MDQENNKSKINVILITVALVLFVIAAVYYIVITMAERPAIELTPGDTIEELETDLGSMETNLSDFEVELKADLESVDVLLRDFELP